VDSHMLRFKIKSGLCELKTNHEKLIQASHNRAVLAEQLSQATQHPDFPG